MEKRFGVAVLGAGNRARYVVKNLLRDSGGAVRVVSAFDPDRTLLDETLRKIWGVPMRWRPRRRKRRFMLPASTG
ncbi:MAG: hypothetical protein L6W00_04495 [Lentisphaeria bacterium]|nr:MAG: hypothetical protein L6W00_04495 [Lentisphaeria bacterium]